MFPDELSQQDLLRRQVMLAMEGYAELEIYDLAWEELTRLAPQDQEHPDVQEMVLALLMKESRWAEAVKVGKMLCHDCPDQPQPFIHTAFCLHEMGETALALKMLRHGPHVLQQQALYHYNCACYLAVLGHELEAREMLRKAFALDPKLQDEARTDPDLASLRRR